MHLNISTECLLNGQSLKSVNPFTLQTISRETNIIWHLIYTNLMKKNNVFSPQTDTTSQFLIKVIHLKGQTGYVR